MFYYICEGEVMTSSLSNVNIQTPQTIAVPSAAAGLGGAANFTLAKKNIVINPPQHFYKFSVRRESKLDTEFAKNYMNMLIESLHKHPVKKNKNTKQNGLLFFALTGGALALFCKRSAIFNYLQKSFNILKTKIPYLQGKI